MLKKLLKENKISIIAIILFFVLEIIAITYTNCIPILEMPLYPLLIFSFIIIIGYMLKNNIVRTIFYTIVSIIELIIDVMFIFLYDSNGTVFEWAMYNQRNDAYGTLEKFDLQKSYLIIGGILILIFIIISIILIYKNKNNKKPKIYYKKALITELIISILIVAIPYIENTFNYKKYTYKFYDSTANNYQNIGILGNAMHQIIGKEKTVNIKDFSNIDNFIYQDEIYKSPYNGISKDNNLILILVESLEWYPFELFPEYSDKLYPNLTKFYNEGLIGNNFYQKEKTDVSESLAVLGNYPTGKYINYDFATNSYPFSLPNLIKHDATNKNKKIKVNSFHANYGKFYNRYTLHQSWGFDKLYAIDEMKAYGVKDEWQNKKGERNLDSIAMEKMKKEMFPTNSRFFSYLISFTMHGYYGKRNNLKDYYDIIDSYHLFDDKTTENDEYLKTYMAALMDFDKSIGIMMNYLEKNKLLDNTTIILFADHNSYYNRLSNYAKNIDEKYSPELFRIPLAIYDKKLVNEYIKNENSNIISKFITTSDITPTVLDIFGINGYKNIYFGNTIFNKDVQSIVYSRNYNIFITEKIVAYSKKSIISTTKDYTKKDLKDIEQRAITHLNKLEYTDKIYYSDYFKDNEYIYN